MGPGAHTLAWVMDEATLRRARPGEAALLSALALRSKAHWGYDEAFMEACRADLTVTPGDIARQPYFVAEQDGRVVGFYNLAGEGDEATLQNLFVSPEVIGHGLGKRLWRHLEGEARQAGFPFLLIHSDPHAEPFYLRMGARRVGWTSSTVFPGRRLPLLRFDLTPQKNSSSSR